MNPLVSNGNKLRWKFENIGTLNEEGMFSDKFSIGPVDWRIKVFTTTENNIKYLSVRLCYDSDNKNKKNWFCEARDKFKLLKQTGSGNHHIAGSYANAYHESKLDWGFAKFNSWNNCLQNYTSDNSIIIEIDLSFQYYDFSKKIENFTDIIANVEENEFHLNKGFLFAKSQHFYDWLSTDHVSHHITLHLVTAKEFCYILTQFSPMFNTIKADTLDRLIEVAKKYSVSSIHHACEQFLISNTGLANVNKIKYAEDNDYEGLMVSCIESLKSGTDVKNLQANPKFVELKETVLHFGSIHQFLSYVPLKCRLLSEERFQMNPVVSNGNKLRWKFENVKNLTNNGMCSEKFSIDQTDWKIMIRTTEPDDYLSIGLCYDSDNKEDKHWICEVDAKYRVLKQDGDKKHMDKNFDGSRCFHQSSQLRGISRFALWSDILSENGGYLKDDSIIVEVYFDFKYYDFSKKIPGVTDFTVNVEDTEFHVNKWALGSRSKFFYDFIITNKLNNLSIIKLDDVKAKDFCYMLASLYPFFEPNLEYNYSELIELAKKFHVSSLHHICEQYLIKDTKLEKLEKIKLAEENDYEKLMKTCIQALTNGLDIKELKMNEKFSELKEATKLRILYRSLDFF